MLHHVASFRIRYHECDQQGHVFNAHYLALFDMTVTELWRAHLGGYGAMVAEGTDIVVAEAHVRYLGPAHFDEVMDVAVQVCEPGTTSMRTEYRVSRGEDLLATGWVRHVFVDAAAMTKRPIPDRIRAALRPG
ncbi:MAG: acyl-CoA thioesterase [Solirubrobacterales bacterium]|nr:acyl-CoA thioesterase [Solirubrobacterales bacterium]